MDANAPVLSSVLFLDGVGEVFLTLNPEGLSWNTIHADTNASSCCGVIFHLEPESEIKFTDTYAVEYIGLGLINGCLGSGQPIFMSPTTEMYRFVVHGFQRGKYSNSPFVLTSYTFGERDPGACQTWFDRINDHIKLQVQRPKNLLVFVHPRCGKGHGHRTWETVAPLFSLAKVETKVTVTQKAGHAYDILKSTMDRELSYFDGIVSVGGDGLFNEVLNGLLSSRHNAPCPPAPTTLSEDIKAQLQLYSSVDDNDRRSSADVNKDVFLETSGISDDCEPLLSASESTESCTSNNILSDQKSCSTGQNNVLMFPNNWFRLGIIPAGSTDAIVISTTGVRDPVTSALHIILGRKISLDVAQVVRWKTSPSCKGDVATRYAASFTGYGFYGDVVKESEKYRWMGPSRYDLTGTKVFLEHRSYEAEVCFLEPKTTETVNEIPNEVAEEFIIPGKNLSKRICLINCSVCNQAVKASHVLTDRDTLSLNVPTEEPRWLRRKGRFLSVGAAIISCRNERAPQGLVADAHLSDGFLHLILVKDCPRPLYLWHLIKLTRKGSDPLNFSFVEHHKTNAFTFVANHDGSVWNLDGELFQACEVTVKACQGLINLFASGPEV
ncbi:hypothetical protein HPP92_025402 [Vanilla planifolia]|uniref:DAGKc domain-containing protein n=1 Tax=Vanilla planifolia TaxID=51239 RepID=A0A835PMN6_VANPL|nr:hypothetical protein HPP92_025402 [Vanilla planifolia]